jgi:23S rRNA pseudouridine1911/1915/1917 synthase
VTHWRVLDSGRAGDLGVTAVACRLETGRTHQIRVHLAHAKCPVSGDRRYGASSVVADRLGLDRPFLHAAELAFDHPVTGRRVHVREPLPDDLVRVCTAAGVDPAASLPEDPDDVG